MSKNGFIPFSTVVSVSSPVCPSELTMLDELLVSARAASMRKTKRTIQQHREKGTKLPPVLFAIMPPQSTQPCVTSTALGVVLHKVVTSSMSSFVRDGDLILFVYSGPAFLGAATHPSVTLSRRRFPSLSGSSCDVMPVPRLEKQRSGSGRMVQTFYLPFSYALSLFGAVLFSPH